MSKLKFPTINHGALQGSPLYINTNSAGSSQVSIEDNVKIKIGNIEICNEAGTCMSCKTENTTIVFKYTNCITRAICKKCATKAMDAVFGIDINVEAEEVLYGDK